MTKTEIKKAIYKAKPEARLDFIRIGVAYYNAELNDVKIIFEIPVSDMGDADFYSTMEAKLLLRWLVTGDE